MCGQPEPRKPHRNKQKVNENGRSVIITTPILWPVFGGAACSPAMKFRRSSHVCSGFRSNKNPRNPAKRSKMHNTCRLRLRPSHTHILRLYSNKNARDKTLDHCGWPQTHVSYHTLGTVGYGSTR